MHAGEVKVYGQRGRISEVEYSVYTDETYTVVLDNGAMITRVPKKDVQPVLPKASTQALGTFAKTRHQKRDEITTQTWVKVNIDHWVSVDYGAFITRAYDKEIDTSVIEYRDKY